MCFLGGVGGKSFLFPMKKHERKLLEKSKRIKRWKTADLELHG